MRSRGGGGGRGGKEVNESKVGGGGRQSKNLRIVALWRVGNGGASKGVSGQEKNIWCIPVIRTSITSRGGMKGFVLLWGRRINKEKKLTLGNKTSHGCELSNKVADWRNRKKEESLNIVTPNQAARRPRRLALMKRDRRGERVRIPSGVLAAEIRYLVQKIVLKGQLLSFPRSILLP